MDVFAELARMQERLLTDNGAALETHYGSQCAAIQPQIAQRIAGTDLSLYCDRQYDAYCKALKKARTAAARAIYCEYDIDNDWQTFFYVCKEYTEIGAGDDDWACRWVTQVRGSCIPEFTRIYKATGGFCNNNAATAITLFLIARTTARLMATVTRKMPGEIRVCIGYHDQDPIHRL